MTGMLGTKYRVFKAQAGDRDGCMVALKKIPYNVKR